MKSFLQFFRWYLTIQHQYIVEEWNYPKRKIWRVAFYVMWYFIGAGLGTFLVCGWYYTDYLLRNVRGGDKR